MDHPHRHLTGGRRRRKLPRTAALAAAAVTLAWTASTGAAAAGTTQSSIKPAYAVLSAAENGMATLMGSYNSSSGLIGNVWWQSAVALSTLMTYQQATGDTEYSYAISTAFNDNKSGNFENTFMDDTGWWGVAWLQAYNLTGNTQYLDMAETIANYIHGYWSSECNGGIWWNTTANYKNAITNELFLELTAGLHNAISGDTTYLSWANQEWTWLSTGSNLIGSNYLISDGDTPPSSGVGDCTTGGTTWTYNQGVILAGLTELYKATGNSSLLTEAQNIADAAILKLNATGVLNEPCSTCDSDQQSFKGIFVRGLKELSNALNTQWYASFYENQVNSIIPNDTDTGNQMGFLWQGPYSDPNASPNDGLTSYSQASAEDALVAGLSLGNNGSVLSGASNSVCLDDYGSGRTAGTQIDVWGCNSTPGQSWSTPAPGATGEMHIVDGCATVNNGTANGTKVVWDTCTGSAQQKWTWETTSNPYDTYVYNAYSGKCMDNTGDSTANGNPIQIWTCNKDTAQTWHLP
jgi:predicted alpha-1,6-mannanase (GH76 family)